MAKGLCVSVLGMLVMACSGSGGGGGGSTPPVAQTTQSVPKTVVIDAEGDSTFYGTQVINGVVSRTANNPPALLQGMLGANVTVINSAAGGATVLDALNGLAPRYTTPLASRLATNNSALVLSNFEINDSLRLSQDDYRAGLLSWITRVRNMGKLPVLEEPNPVCSPTYPNVEAYLSVLRDVAAQQGVTLIAQYDYIKSLPNWQAMLTDCVHPYDSLYQIKTQREYAMLQPIVAKLLQ
ncbi:SGNH/GDSL hydrolase family protein [Paraburkholderia aromaticivorans]|uniref:SGNH hydrolase-type esterase domain-containing protein n=1 Tax=Paraburkholderia aromaticivorans TaxID=2026199 RepID=A0A248VM77_9BURK|nr:SGNH/GDSL hydrolase family protein [Paraburkholderia aromaticivorans]ASW00127.1 hypothetical protein CJU94_19420 [Paraburkholderia aromaticivorans]